ncbi:MAG: penicillin-binding protein activator [Candidatus Saccharibacteria bacterium]|nr:penicillin-binding protein activator [Pseudorhodobacter sp.]
MFAALSRVPALFARLLFVFAAFALAACDPGVGPTASVPARNDGGPVAVALLVPGGSSDAKDNFIAQNLENAARLAMADLSGVQIDLRVYNTQGSPEQAGAMAAKAVSEGATIILGPFFALEANAAGAAVAASGVNVLSFSNNPDVAGGNVFILGQTFDTTASRLASFAVSRGLDRIMVINGSDPTGQIGKAAIQTAVAQAGGTVAAVGTYEFSQNGIVQAVPGIVASAKSSGANAFFLTGESTGSVPLLSQLLMENGLNPASNQFIGLSRWDIPPATLELPGVQSAWFALPDPSTNQQFQARFQAAYGDFPPIYAGLAYDGIAAIGAIAKRGGAGSLTTAALTQPAGFVGVGGIFRLNGRGTTDRGLAIAQIQDKRLVVIDPAPSNFGGAGF